MAIDSKFVHLQVHSEFSLLDGAIRIPKLLSDSNEQGRKAIALTDKGNLFGAIDFYFGAKSKGILPIIGCEIHLAEDMSVKTKTCERLILLCQNQVGYETYARLYRPHMLRDFIINHVPI